MDSFNRFLDRCPPVRKELVLMGAVLFARSKIDADDAATVERLRVLFAVVQGAVVLSLLLLQFYFIPNSPNAQEQISVFPEDLRSPTSTDLGESDEKDKHGRPKKIKITIAEYDAAKLAALRTKVMMGIALGFGIHLYFKLPLPLLVQSILQPLTVWQDPVFRVNVLQRTGENYPALRRPWKDDSQSGVAGMMKKFLDGYKKDAVAEIKAEEAAGETKVETKKKK